MKEYYKIKSWHDDLKANYKAAEEEMAKLF